MQEKQNVSALDLDKTFSIVDVLPNLKTWSAPKTFTELGDFLSSLGKSEIELKTKARKACDELLDSLYKTQGQNAETVEAINAVMAKVNNQYKTWIGKYFRDCGVAFDKDSKRVKEFKLGSKVNVYSAESYAEWRKGVEFAPAKQKTEKDNTPEIWLNNATGLEKLKKAVGKLKDSVATHNDGALLAMVMAFEQSLTVEKLNDACRAIQEAKNLNA